MCEAACRNRKETTEPTARSRTEEWGRSSHLERLTPERQRRGNEVDREGADRQQEGSRKREFRRPVRDQAIATHGRCTAYTTPQIRTSGPTTQAESVTVCHNSAGPLWMTRNTSSSRHRRVKPPMRTSLFTSASDAASSSCLSIVALHPESIVLGVFVSNGDVSFVSRYGILRCCRPPNHRYVCACADSSSLARAA